MMGMRDPEEERLEREAKAREERRKLAKRATIANVCYEDFFQYFQFAEINWIGKEFYYQISGDVKTVTKEAMFRLTEKWLEHRWAGPGRSLETLKVNEDLIERVKTKMEHLDDGAENFDFSTTVAFIYHYQHFHLMKEKTAGFTKGDVDRYDTVFRNHCMGRPDAKATELWKILHELGFDFPTLEDQDYIISLVRQSDKNKSGTIDFEELLNLLRTIIDDEKVKARKREHELIMKSKMNYEECDQWIDVFTECAGENNRIQMPDVKALFESLQLKWSSEGTKKLMEWLRQVDEDSNGEIDFGEFCCLVQKMWDDNFGDIKNKVGDAMRAATELEVTPADANEPTSPPANRRRTSWIEVVADEVDKKLDPDSAKSTQMIAVLEKALAHPTPDKA